MNLEEFNKIKECTDLIDIRGGGSNSHYVFNKIYDLILENLASGNNETAIKYLITEMLSNYEIQTSKLGTEAKDLMRKLGMDLE